MNIFVFCLSRKTPDPSHCCHSTPVARAVWGYADFLHSPQALELLYVFSYLFSHTLSYSVVGTRQFLSRMCDDDDNDDDDDDDDDEVMLNVLRCQLIY